jgi:hypothetical protein
MEYPEAVQRLLNHANLPSAEFIAADGLLQALARGPVPGSDPAVVSQLADVVHCYEVINRHLNGSVPTQRSWDAKAITPLDRTLAYAVSTLLCGCWQLLHSKETQEQTRDTAWRQLSHIAHALELGWNLVLASDYDSIAQEIGYYYTLE